MIRPHIEKWGQQLADLRELSIQAAHPRTRERYLALYMIGSQQTNASRWAAEIGRNVDTVLDWVHTYNEQGPEGLTYHRSGGRRPLFVPKP